jgi:hypothetical protein
VIEMSWLAISLTAAALTVTNIITGWRAWQIVKHHGETDAIFLARLTVAKANIRRDVLRFASIAGCIALVIPSLQRPGDVVLSPVIVVAMLIPVSIALNSFLDRHDRLRIEALL